MSMFSHAVRVSVVLWGACLSAHAAKPACDAAAPATVEVVSSSTVSSFANQQRKEVLTFVGFLAPATKTRQPCWPTPDAC